MEQSVKLLADLGAAIGTRLSTLFEQSANAREAQDRRDAMVAYSQGQAKWLEGTDRALKLASQIDLSATGARLPALKLELIGNEVVESKILSSRLTMRILDKASWDYNDLQVRIRTLDGKEELDKNDILRPECFAQNLLEQWLSAGLSQEAWVLVQDVIQQSFGDKIVKAYKATNEFLIAQGVMKEIDLRSNVKRTPNSKTGGGSGAGLGTDAGSLPGHLPSGPQGPGDNTNYNISGVMDDAYAVTQFGQPAFAQDNLPSRRMPPSTGAMSRAGNASSQIAEHITRLRAQAAQYGAQQAAQRLTAQRGAGTNGGAGAGSGGWDGGSAGAGLPSGNGSGGGGGGGGSSASGSGPATGSGYSSSSGSG